MMDKYGKQVVQDCIAELLDMAEAHMRKLIAEVPDGTYTGTAILEDAGHGFGDFEITATVTITGDNCHIAVNSPRRCRISSTATKATATRASTWG